ncbi:MAG: CpsB/CapC family capsule biosynthesis tyrosine phosphatase [Rikenellaceae bacterium]
MFFRRKILAAELLQGLTDCHSHILPNVDDGVRTLEESLQILSYYEAFGVQRVILTPHIMDDYPRNRATFLREEFAALQGAYDGAVELTLAAEYMLDGCFMEHLASGDLLPLFENYLLVESSCVDSTINIKSLISQIMSRGYFVVLAHPERYLYLSQSDYRELRAMQVRFQLNLPSLLGCYGDQVRVRAERLLKSGMYDLVGSDIHAYNFHSRVLNTTKLSRSKVEQVEGVKSRMRALMSDEI